MLSDQKLIDIKLKGYDEILKKKNILRIYFYIEQIVNHQIAQQRYFK